MTDGTTYQTPWRRAATARSKQGLAFFLWHREKITYQSVFAFIETQVYGPSNCSEFSRFLCADKIYNPCIFICRPNASPGLERPNAGSGWELVQYTSTTKTVTRFHRAELALDSALKIGSLRLNLGSVDLDNQVALKRIRRSKADAKTVFFEPNKPPDAEPDLCSDCTDADFCP